MKRRLPDPIPGTKYGRLTVVASAETGKNRMVEVACECGSPSKIVQWGAVLDGRVVGCGCVNREHHRKRLSETPIGAKVHFKKHGLWRSPTYRTWQSMKTRCLNPNSDHRANYMDRGIGVAVRWLEFENFLADMGERPPGKTLDRVNNNKGYHPANCRWATPKEQALNRRRVLTWPTPTLIV